MTSHTPGTAQNVPCSDDHQSYYRGVLEIPQLMYKSSRIHFCASIATGNGWKELLKDFAIGGTQEGAFFSSVEMILLLANILLSIEEVTCVKVHRDSSRVPEKAAMMQE